MVWADPEGTVTELDLPAGKDQRFGSVWGYIHPARSSLDPHWEPAHGTGPFNMRPVFFSPHNPFEMLKVDTWMTLP